MKRITLIITALNENDEVNKTLKSLFDNTNKELFDVIVVNDGSFENKVSKGWVNIPKKYPVKVIHHKIRHGIHVSRTEGVDYAETPYIGFLNARMRFEAGWLEKVLSELDKDQKAIYCTTSKILDEKGEHDTTINNGYLYGAEIVFHQESEDHIYKHRILYPKWIYEKKKGTYEVPCVLGAMYFMTKKWFQFIGGLEGLSSYGSDEEFLSLKTWIFGGKCKIISDISVGNVYRKVKTYNDNIEDFLFNRYLISYLLFSHKDFKKVVNWYSESDYFNLMNLRFALNINQYIGLKIKYSKLTINNYNNYLRR